MWLASTGLWKRVLRESSVFFDVGAFVSGLSHWQRISLSKKAVKLPLRRAPAITLPHLWQERLSETIWALFASSTESEQRQCISEKRKDVKEPTRSAVARGLAHFGQVVVFGLDTMKL